MTTWQILLAAGISVLVALLTNWVSSVLRRPSRRVALLSAVGAFVLATLGFWLTNPPAGDPCVAIKGALEPFGATATLGEVKTFSARLNGGDQRDLVYDWNATRGVTRPGHNSNSPQTQYQAPTDYVGDDIISVHVRAPGCGERGAATWTATVVVVDEVVAQVTPTVTPRPSPSLTLPPPASTGAPTPTLPPGAGRVRPKDQALMLFVPAGTFTMGSAATDSVAEGDEIPAHAVTLDAFWIDKLEVTNFQYAQCVNAGACKPSSLVTDTDYNGQSQPVVGVSWQDADD